MTHYLTQGVVTKYEEIKDALKDRYAWHQKLWTFFPGTASNTIHEFLWRLDRKEAATIVWVLSTQRPETPKDWGRWQTKEVAETFLSHRLYEFVLCANPTIKQVVRLEDGSRKKNGRRVAIVRSDELEQWLASKGEEGGFNLRTVQCASPTREYFYKTKEKRGVHSSVEFRGVLEVVDSEKFAETWRQGLGSAKSFGFGMLLLNPLN